MENKELISRTSEFVRTTLAGAEGGHDWWHTFRVFNMARRMAETENADPLVTSLAALLHDIADAKFHGGDETIGPKIARDFLHSLGVDENIIRHVILIMTHISFRDGYNAGEFHSPELAVVQDADRLDAMGAIGIARAFNYGGYKNREMYNPEIAPDPAMDRKAYMKSKAPTINHFYEKLLLLRDRMNTKSGKAMAMHRHQVMLNFLEEFYGEWEGHL